jgi:hypothetical protein
MKHLIRTVPWWPLVLIASTVAVGALTFGGMQSPVRPLVAVWFLAICPGMALVRLMHVPDRFMELTLAVALSIALSTIVSSIQVYAHLWSPGVGLGVLMGVTLLGLALGRGRQMGARTQETVP